MRTLSYWFFDHCSPCTARQRGSDRRRDFELCHPARWVSLSSTHWCDNADWLEGFMLYCFTVFIFTIVMIFGVAPRYGRSNPLVYISICSLVGSVSIMAIKGFGVAVKLTFGGNNQFTHPSTYAFGIVVVGCIVVQMNFFNKALDTFSTNV